MKLDGWLLAAILVLQGSILTVLFYDRTELRHIHDRLDAMGQRFDRQADPSGGGPGPPGADDAMAAPSRPILVAITPPASPPPKPESLSTVWIMPHPPANAGRFVRFESYREQKGVEGQTVLVFREWTGKQYVDTPVPQPEVRWDVQPQ